MGDGERSTKEAVTAETVKPAAKDTITAGAVSTRDALPPSGGSVTFIRKRYILTCVACGLLTSVSRRNALTCSTRCRVSLHRHRGALDQLRQSCRQFGDIEPFLVLESRALRVLRPDFVAAIEAGTLGIDAVRADVVRAFDELVWKIACDSEHASVMPAETIGTVST